MFVMLVMLFNSFHMRARMRVLKQCGINIEHQQHRFGSKYVDLVLVLGARIGYPGVQALPENLAETRNFGEVGAFEAPVGYTFPRIP